MITAYSQQNFSDKELLAFYRVYKYTLDKPFEPFSVMQKLLSQVNISEERMTEIIQAETLGKTIQLSEQEKKSMEELKKLMQKEKEKYDLQIDKMMQQEKLSAKRFEAIKIAYHQDASLRQKIDALIQKNNH
ncbi:MAG: hypothetical protein OHK0045_18810 [Raineya sp.]